jgi:hypothetical protein
MAFFWFTQKTEASKNYFCFGIGKYDDTKCTGNETESFFEVSSPFKMIKLMGVASDAAFNWGMWFNLFFFFILQKKSI